jgi:hypothetical protein
VRIAQNSICPLAIFLIGVSVNGFLLMP